MKETILSIPSPFGPPVDLIQFSWEGILSKETISIVSGIQGNHLNGIYLCSQLIRFFDSVEAGQEPSYYLKGRVKIIPAVNLPAIQEGKSLWSFHDLDMNLAFPGNGQGEIVERIATAVYEQTKDSKFGIILQNAEKHYEDDPHLFSLNPDGLTRDFARSLGPKNMREHRTSPTFRLCLYNQWIEQMITSVILSAGKQDYLDRPLCDTLFSGLINSFLWIGVLGSNQKKPKKHPLRFNRRDKEQFVFSPFGGFFLPAVKLGSEIKKGQKIGDVVDIYSGIVLKSLLAKSNGYLVTLRSHPMVYQKEVLAVLLTKSKSRFWFFK